MEQFLLLLLGGYAAVKVLGGSGSSASTSTAGKKATSGGITSIASTGSYYAPAAAPAGKTAQQLAAEIKVTVDGVPPFGVEPWGTGDLETDQKILAAAVQMYGTASMEVLAVTYAISLDRAASVSKAQSDSYVAQARANKKWCFTQLGASFDPTDPHNAEQSDGTWVVNGAWDDGGHDGYHDGMNVGRVTGFVDEPSNFWGDIGTGLKDIGKGLAFVATVGQVNLFSEGPTSDPQGAGIDAGVQAGIDKGQSVENDVESGNLDALSKDAADAAAVV